MAHHFAYFTQIDKPAAFVASQILAVQNNYRVLAATPQFKLEAGVGFHIIGQIGGFVQIDFLGIVVPQLRICVIKTDHFPGILRDGVAPRRWITPHVEFVRIGKRRGFDFRFGGGNKFIRIELNELILLGKFHIEGVDRDIAVLIRRLYDLGNRPQIHQAGSFVAGHVLAVYNHVDNLLGVVGRAKKLQPEGRVGFHIIGNTGGLIEIDSFGIVVPQLRITVIKAGQLPGILLDGIAPICRIPPNGKLTVIGVDRGVAAFPCRPGRQGGRDHAAGQQQRRRQSDG